MDRKTMIHYAIIALLIVSIALLGYHIHQMKKMSSAERFQESKGLNSAEHFNVEGDTSNAAEHFRRQKEQGLAAEHFRRGPGQADPSQSAERFGVGSTTSTDAAPMAAHLHTRLNRNTGRLYTGEAFGMRKRLN